MTFDNLTLEERRSLHIDGKPNLTIAAQKRQERRDKLLAEGKCSKCGEVNPDKEHKLCPKCREALRKQAEKISSQKNSRCITTGMSIEDVCRYGEEHGGLSYGKAVVMLEAEAMAAMKGA